jgi:hypothetical protein
MVGTQAAAGGVCTGWPRRSGTKLAGSALTEDGKNVATTEGPEIEADPWLPAEFQAIQQGIWRAHCAWTAPMSALSERGRWMRREPRRLAIEDHSYPTAHARQ